MKNSTIVPDGVMRPIRPLAPSVNHRLPSGPGAMPYGCADEVLGGIGIGYSVTLPLGVMSPILSRLSSPTQMFPSGAGVKSDRAKIVPGTYVGRAAVTQPDGTLRAQEVHIFPEAMRGTGEGHRPYDLGPQSTMTNGTVDTSAVVESVGDRVLTLKYKGGEKKLFVSKDTPIVAYEAGDAKALVLGAHVYIIAQRGPDGTLSSGRVNVGKNGLVPPM